MPVINAGAVSEHTMKRLDGILKLNLVKGSSVHGTMENRDPFGTPTHELYVDVTRATTVDQEINSETQSIDLMLVQTNGAEVEVLLGASQVFKNRKVRKLILRTWLWAPYVTPEDAREIRGEEKWNLMDKILTQYGCKNITRTKLHESENSVTAYCH